MIRSFLLVVISLLVGFTLGANFFYATAAYERSTNTYQETYIETSDAPLVTLANERQAIQEPTTVLTSVGSCTCEHCTPSVATLIPLRPTEVKTVVDWLGTLRDFEIPSNEVISKMEDALANYTVTLASHEGLWLAERFKQNDWRVHGPTVDEVIILYLGPQRILREVPQSVGDALRVEWAEEGYFGTGGSK
jgi:hypothetical protein